MDNDKKIKNSKIVAASQEFPIPDTDQPIEEGITDPIPVPQLFGSTKGWGGIMTAQELSEQYAVNIYGALGFGWLQSRKAVKSLGQAILYTAMNAALKCSKEVQPE